MTKASRNPDWNRAVGDREMRGLSLVKQLVELYGGDVTVDSDGEGTSRETTALILRERGAYASTVSSVSAALAALEKTLEIETTPFDVLLSDIGLPGQDGYELIRG